MIHARVVAILLGACEGNASVGPSSSSSAIESPAPTLLSASVSEVPSDAGTDGRAATRAGSSCPPPVRIPPRILATTWPKYLGLRVSLICRAIRRFDFTRTVVVADGAKFIVVSAPDVSVCERGTSTFLVMGSSTVALGGRVVLPELLAGGGECSR